MFGFSSLLHSPFSLFSLLYLSLARSRFLSYSLLFVEAAQTSQFGGDGGGPDDADVVSECVALLLGQCHGTGHVAAQQTPEVAGGTVGRAAGAFAEAVAVLKTHAVA